jgi:predicted ATPase
MDVRTLRLLRLEAKQYRSLRDVSLTLGQLNVLIGPNGSGKSNLLDAMRFLSVALVDGVFDRATAERGGIHMAWKGQSAEALELNTRFADSVGSEFEWRVKLRFGGVRGNDTVEESIREYRAGLPPMQLLSATAGEGWWWSERTSAAEGASDQGAEGWGDQHPLPDNSVKLKLSPTSCALAAASADASFRARALANFVRGWRFFDPAPLVLRRPGDSADVAPLELAGRNLAARLLELKTAAPERFNQIVTALGDVVGYSVGIEPRESAEDGRVFLLLDEPTLRFRVHQIGASSGTLRVLALLTGLLGEDGATLVGIEEPENYIHPAAIESLAEYLRTASTDLQVIITTHAPHLLDALDDPEAVCVVRRTEAGTEVRRESNGAAIREALDQSGLRLGQLHTSKGFGQTTA